MNKLITVIAVTLIAVSALAGKVQITDSDTSEVATVVDGALAQPTTAQIPYLLSVSMGNVTGASSIAKFAKNEATTTGDDIWAGEGVYDFYPTNALAAEILSSDTNDVDQGTGAWTVLVQGLDDDLYEVQEIATMNGTNIVALTNTYRRIYRAIVLTCGTLPTNAGDITVRETGAGETGAVILADEGQTAQGSYTIPKGKTGYIYQTYVGLSDDDKAGETCIFQIYTRINNGHTGAWSMKGEVGCGSLGSSTWKQEIQIPGTLPEMTDLKVIARSASATLGTFAGYTVLLIDD